jgi:hypothetical protein
MSRSSRNKGVSDSDPTARVDALKYVPEFLGRYLQN